MPEISRSLYNYVEIGQKKLTLWYQPVLFIFSVLFFILTIIFSLALMLSDRGNQDIAWNLFKQNGYKPFLEKFSLSLGLGGIWLAITTLFFTVRRINQTDHQLQLIEKQRAISQQPDLLCLRNDIKVSLKTPNPGQYNFEYYLKDSDKKISPYVQLVNVGFGVAKNVSIKYAFDVKEAMERLKVLEPVIKLNLLKENVVDFQFERQRKFYQLEGGELSREIAFILPESKNGNVIQLRIPISYLEMYFLNFCCVGLDPDNFFQIVHTFPQLTIDINYEDIEFRK